MNRYLIPNRQNEEGIFVWGYKGTSIVVIEDLNDTPFYTIEGEFISYSSIEELEHFNNIH